MTHSRQALLLYANGCSCEQSIFGAFADVLGVSPVRAMQMAPRRSQRGSECGAMRAASLFLEMIYEGIDQEEEAAARLRKLYLKTWGITDCKSIKAKTGRWGCDEVIVTTTAMVEGILLDQRNALRRRK